MSDANREWNRLLQDLYYRGHEVSPVSAGANFKGRTTRELLAHTTRWDMSRPVITSPSRNLGYRFMTAEAAWTLAGDNRLAIIKPYGRAIATFTDDGRTMSGAYGPPFVDQAGWVVRTLAADPSSRQAVATIWRPRPGPTNDTPCTVALQWLIRNDASLHGSGAPQLHCVATMRSSDAWTGVPYDVFNFSMMSAYIMTALRQHDRHLGREVSPLSLGSLYLTAGSQHLYKQDWEDAHQCMNDDRGADLEPYDGLLATTDDLVRHLWLVADREAEEFDASPSSFLHELMADLPRRSE